MRPRIVSTAVVASRSVLTVRSVRTESACELRPVYSRHCSPLQCAIGVTDHEHHCFDVFVVLKQTELLRRLVCPLSAGDSPSGKNEVVAGLGKIIGCLAGIFAKRGIERTDPRGETALDSIERVLSIPRSNYL